MMIVANTEGFLGQNDNEFQKIFCRFINGVPLNQILDVKPASDPKEDCCNKHLKGKVILRTLHALCVLESENPFRQEAVAARMVRDKIAEPEMSGVHYRTSVVYLALKALEDEALTQECPDEAFSTHAKGYKFLKFVFNFITKRPGFESLLAPSTNTNVTHDIPDAAFAAKATAMFR